MQWLFRLAWSESQQKTCWWSALKQIQSTWSHWSCSRKKAVLKNFAKFTRKHLCLGLFLNKVASLKPATFLKKKLYAGAFPLILRNFQEHLFYRTPPGNCFWQSLTNSTPLISFYSNIDYNIKHLTECDGLFERVGKNFFIYNLTEQICGSFKHSWIWDNRILEQNILLKVNVEAATRGVL